MAIAGPFWSNWVRYHNHRPPGHQIRKNEIFSHCLRFLVEKSVFRQSFVGQVDIAVIRDKIRLHMDLLLGLTYVM